MRIRTVDDKIIICPDCAGAEQIHNPILSKNIDPYIKCPTCKGNGRVREVIELYTYERQYTSSLI